MIKTIAETAWHHDGDFEFMQNLIEEIIKNTEVNYIKLHITIDFDEYMSPDHPGYNFLKEKLFTKEQWYRIIKTIKDSDKELMLLLNDTKAVEFGMQFSPSLLEVHSVCLNDIHLLASIKENNKDNTSVLLGVGGSTLYEIENAISFLETDNIVLMHGFQNYPTKYEDVNFNRIRKLINLYPCFKHGYADHTVWNETNNNFITLLGAALGMEFIEKHVTTVPGIERTDWHAAIGIEQFNNLLNSLKILDKCNGNGLLKLNEGEKKYSIFGPNKKAAFLEKDLKKGHQLMKQDITFKRTQQLTDASQTEVWELIGKNAIESYDKGTLITKDKFK
jgi:N,N'-diacetyllegionaminate synthase